MSMDLTPLIYGRSDFTWNQRLWVSLWFGLAFLAVSFLVDRRTRDDYAFWGVPLRHARLLGRALSDGEPERSQQAPLLSDQHRADADLGTAGPPRLHRLRRPRCFRLFGPSRLHRLQGLAPLPVRALGPRAGDHLAWNLLSAPSNPDRRSYRRTPAG